MSHQDLMKLADAFASAKYSYAHVPSMVEKPRAALSDALKAVCDDAARLDHLAKSVRCSSANIDGNHSWNFMYGHGWKMGANFREAVDRSMKESK
jgi:hypothetical protein